MASTSDAVLRRRAEHLAEAVSVAADAINERLVLAEFSLGDNRYALPFTELRAALPLADVTPVPLAPAHVIGILRFKSHPITALSLASLLGIQGWRRDPAVLLVIAAERKLVAFDCEVVPKLTRIPRATVEVCRARDKGPVVEIGTALGEVLYLIEINRLLRAKGLL